MNLFCGNEGNRCFKETVMGDEEQEKRRNTDLNIWEKRITLWIMTAMIGVATTHVMGMSGDIKVIRNDLTYNKETDIQQTLDIKENGEDIDVLEFDHQAVAVRQELNRNKLKEVDGRLCNVEEQLKIKIPSHDI